MSNRIVKKTGEFEYSYAPGNKRVWKGTWDTGTGAQTKDEITFYGIAGERLVAYDMDDSGTLTATSQETYIYFGGKLIKNGSGYVTPDRLGSIGKYYPYGQERPSATSDDKVKFGTYYRDDETGLDYAMNRYEEPGDGRFVTPDPYMASGGPADPGSWNRYAYTRGDPINRIDVAGLQDQVEIPGNGGGSITVTATASPVGAVAGGWQSLGSGYSASFLPPACIEQLGPGALTSNPTLLMFSDCAAGPPNTEGVAVGPFTFNNWGSSDQKKMDVIKDRLNFIADNIDSKCQNWLLSNSSSQSIREVVDSLFKYNAVGYADISVASGVPNAVTGAGVGEFAILVNTGGTVFNKNAPKSVGFAYNAQISAINPGSQRAGVLTLLHELAHFLFTPGFRADGPNTNDVLLNNDDVWRNCSSTILGASN